MSFEFNGLPHEMPSYYCKSILSDVFVAVLSTPMYNAILSHWPSESIIYHYRPMRVTLHTIGIITAKIIGN